MGAMETRQRECEREKGKHARRTVRYREPRRRCRGRRYRLASAFPRRYLAAGVEYLYPSPSFLLSFSLFAASLYLCFSSSFSHVAGETRVSLSSFLSLALPPFLVAHPLAVTGVGLAPNSYKIDGREPDRRREGFPRRSTRRRLLSSIGGEAGGRGGTGGWHA